MLNCVEHFKVGLQLYYIHFGTQLTNKGAPIFCSTVLESVIDKLRPSMDFLVNNGDDVILYKTCCYNQMLL